MRRTSPAILAIALFTLAPHASAQLFDYKNPPQGRFSDEWLDILLGESKIGYGHSTLTRDGDKIKTAMDVRIEMGRADFPVKMQILSTTTETVEGQPLAFSTEQLISDMKVLREGTIKGGKVTIASSQFGVEQKQEFDFPEGAVMTWGALREQLKRGLEPGLEYTDRIYSPDLLLNGAVEAHTKVGDWETFIHDGQQMRGMRIAVTMKTPVGEMEMISWSDKDGRMLKAIMPAPGIGDMVMIAVTQEEALKDFVPPEVFMATTIKVGALDYEDARRITYKISAKSDAIKLDDIPSTGNQRVVKSSEKEAVIEVHHAAFRAEPSSPLPPSQRDQYLSANLIINTDDPELQKVAKQAAGDAKEKFELADNLRKFVTEYISDKSLDIGFATASEVCRNKEGDCSEHAVLLAALGRINGIPSRVAVGLAYVPWFGGASDVFGYHMWTQFHLDGQWYDFDAALRESLCTPRRIAFAVSSLNDAGLADLSLPLLTKIGGIHLEIVDVEKIPKRSKP